MPWSKNSWACCVYECQLASSSVFVCTYVCLLRVRSYRDLFRKQWVVSQFVIWRQETFKSHQKTAAAAASRFKAWMAKRPDRPFRKF